MKKNRLLITLLLLLMTIILINCNFFKTKTISHEDKIHLTLKESFLEFMPYKEIPSYDLILPENEIIKTTLLSTNTNEIIFTHNDDFIISEMLEKLFSEYKEKDRLSVRLLYEDKMNETHLNKNVINKKNEVTSEKVYLKVDNGIIYNEIAYITLENGLQLTTNYRRFSCTKDNNTKMYYSWQYTESVRMILYYPLMVVKNELNIDKFDSDKSILIVALPNGVINTIESRYDPTGLIENDDFLDESYYTYEYADYNQENSKDYDSSEYIEIMKDYYISNYNGRYENNVFIYDYLGFTFSIEFKEKEFIIRYIEK